MSEPRAGDGVAAPMSEPRISDDDLRICLHPDEVTIAPLWSNARIRCSDLALDLRDARARIAELEPVVEAARARHEHLKIAATFKCPPGPPLEQLESELWEAVHALDAAPAQEPKP